MTFPTTGVLDNFNRSDGALGANWTGIYNALVITSNQVYSNTLSGEGVSLWTAATFGPNCEAYIDIPTLPGNDHTIFCYARQTTADLNTDGYAVEYKYKNAVDDECRIYRMDDVVFTQLGATMTGNWTAGDSLGIECISSTIKLYRKNGGTWADYSSGGRSDATYGSAGYIGASQYSQTGRLDNFGGGTIASSGTITSSATKQMYYARMRK